MLPILYFNPLGGVMDELLLFGFMDSTFVGAEKGRGLLKSRRFWPLCENREPMELIGLCIELSDDGDL